MATLRLHLFESVYDWIVDNGHTPYVLVSATLDGVVVPGEHIQDDRIILNIHPRSIDRLTTTEVGLEFMARFNGRSRKIIVPAEALMALYARETSEGVVFQGDSVVTEILAEKPVARESVSKPQGPNLTLVK